VLTRPAASLAALAALALLVSGSAATARGGAPASPTARSGAVRGASGIGDPYFPEDGNGGIDVRSYDVHDAYSFARRRLSGWTTVTLRTTQPLRSFDLDFLLPVRAVSLSTGGSTFSGGLEYLDDGSDTLTQVKLKAEGTLNLFTWGIAGSYTDASFGAHQSYLEGSILWEPIDQLDITGFVAQLDGNITVADDMLSGVGGKYFLAKGANVGAAAVHSDAGTGYEVSVGLDF
jgi:hypothetical protein